MTWKPTICLDFDGVIHSYQSGWRSGSYIPDPPVPGVKEAIEQLQKNGYRVVVFSARCGQPGGVQAIEQWLAEHEIIVDEVARKKPAAVLYVDDRGFRFEGDWDALLTFVQGDMTPWNKKPPTAE